MPSATMERIRQTKEDLKLVHDFQVNKKEWSFGPEPNADESNFGLVSQLLPLT